MSAACRECLSAVIDEDGWRRDPPQDGVLERLEAASVVKKGDPPQANDFRRRRRWILGCRDGQIWDLLRTRSDFIRA